MLVPHHRAGIEIDVCPNCRGVWLDRNELETLMGAGAASAPVTTDGFATTPPPEPSPRDSRRPKGHDAEKGSGSDKSKKSGKKSKAKAKKRKKKSWGDLLGDALEEVLDF